MKTFRKIIVYTLCCGLIIGFLAYEAYSIFKKEYIRQTEIAAEAHESVNHHLDMVKIGVLTEDVETYENNLAGLREQINIISTLSLIESEQADYLQTLKDYVEHLDSKTELLKEMKSAKESIAAAKEKINENYGNKDTLTRDKLKEVKDRLPEFKINVEDFKEEKVTKVVNAVNGILDSMVEKASALTDCIDTCYKDRINEINNELADKIKSFADGVAELNTSFEKEFDFDKMQEIKEGKKEEENVEEKL